MIENTITYDQLIKKTESISNIIIFDKDYLAARDEADTLAKKNGLVIATMPQLISNLQHDVPRQAIRQKAVTVNSAEYNFNVCGEKYYFVGHGVGPLSSTEGLRKNVQNMNLYGFIHLNYEEAYRGIYEKRYKANDGVFSLNEIKRDKSFVCNTPYGILTRFNQMGDFESDLLDSDQFMKSDRVLMYAGSEINREIMANVFFNIEKRKKVVNFNRLNESKISISNSRFEGRPGYLASGDGGLCGIEDGIGIIAGRFVMVDPKAPIVNENNNLAGKLIIEPGESFTVGDFKYEMHNGIYLPSPINK
ncbi:MAG: hypothetical protein WC758_03300 [Candidatus Woesearchaeota archaeon]|jgi:hypothetical protein